MCSKHDLAHFSRILVHFGVYNEEKFKIQTNGLNYRNESFLFPGIEHRSG